MSEMKHTRGPWLAAATVGGVLVYEAGGINRHIAITVESGVPRAEEVANASLIAAAPNLLKALKKCAAVCSGDAMSKKELLDALEAARSAITEAEGLKP